MKNCSGCKKEKLEEEFSRKGDGLQDKCKSCKSLYNKNHYIKDKEKYLERAKKNNPEIRKKYRKLLNEIKSVPCKDCNKQFPPYVMDFDHLEDKKFNIGTSINRFSWETILTEVNKCDIVCANCHRIRTHRRIV